MGHVEDMRQARMRKVIGQEKEEEEEEEEEGHFRPSR